MPAAEILRLHIDEFKDGKLYRRCTKCGEMKEINHFGLRREVGAATGGIDVVKVQAWCRPCRSGRALPSNPPQD